MADHGNAGGELVITAINFEYLMNHFNASKELEFFTPTAFAKFAAKCKELQEKERNGGNSESKENEADRVEETQFTAKNTGKIRIQTMYRPNHRLLPIFGDGFISELHTKNTARTYLWSWIKANKLISTKSKGEVRVNDALFHMLFDSKLFHNKMAKKDGFKDKKFKERIGSISVNSMLHRKDVVSLFDEYLDPYTAIILDEDEEPKYKAGLPPKINITADKRQGRKYMTHVTGLEDYGIAIKEFADDAKRFFSCAVTISDLTGKKSKMKGGATKQKVSIQGNKVKTMDSKDVPGLLKAHYGIPPQYINANSTVTKQGKK